MRNLSQMAKGMTPQQLVQLAGSNSPKAIVNPKSVAAETATFVNNLFVELQGIFPAWRYSFTSDGELNSAKRNWIKAFMEEGINSINQIQLGLKKARASLDPHWPSVGKFMSWCKPSVEDFGLPSKEEAYREAIGNLGEFNTATWSHTAVFEAVKKTTCYALKNLPEKKSSAIFYRNYAIMVERVMRGENLQVDIPKAIAEAPEFRPARPEVEQSCLAEMKKKLGLV